MARITLATIKKFIRQNSGRLLINVRSRFDGMTDCVEQRNGDFSPTVPADDGCEHRLGIHGAWFVFESRDYFEPYSANGLVGYQVSNCCGSFILAVEAERMAA